MNNKPDNPPTARISLPLDRFAIALLLVFCVSWSLQQVAAKLAMPEFPALTQAAVRSVVASVLVGLWCWFREPNVFRKDGTLKAGLFAGLLFSVEFLLLFLGLQWTNASHAVLFLYTSPFFVALGISLLVPSERLRLTQWLGMALSFAGVVLVLRLSGAMSFQVLLGDLFILLAAALWGATTVTVRVTSLRHAPAAKSMLYQLVFSAVFLTLAAWMKGEHWPAEISWLPALSLAYQSVWVGAFTFVGWMWLISHYRAAEIAAFSFITPVLGVLAGWFIMGDEMSANFILAVALVAGGIILVNRQQEKKSQNAR